MSERILTKEESAQLFKKLEMKYGAEINQINKMIYHDITVYGALTAETQRAQSELTEKILEESTSNE